MKRVREFSDAHPLISIAVGVLALFVFAMVMLPPDPPYLDQHHHARGAV